MTLPKKNLLFSELINKRMHELRLRHKDIVNYFETTTDPVSKSTITHWLSGKVIPKGSRLANLCDALNLDYEDIVSKLNNITNESCLLEVQSFVNSNSYFLPFYKTVGEFVEFVTKTSGDMSQEHQNTQVEIPAIILEKIIETTEVKNLHVIQSDITISGLIKNSNIQLIVDKSIKDAKKDGHYVVEYGELKDVKQLKVHPVTGSIKIVDLMGTGSSDETDIKEYNQELIIHAKAVGAFIPM